MGDNYKYLPSFSSWLMNSMDAYTRETLKLRHRFKIPLLEKLKHVTEEQLYELSLEGNTRFFKSVISGDALQTALSDLEAFYMDKNPLIRTGEVVTEDFIRIYQLREVVVSKFIPQYSNDPEVCLQILTELRDLHAGIQEEAFNRYISLANQELTIKNRILEDAQIQTRIGTWHCDLRTGSMYWSGQMYDIFEVPESYSLHRESFIDFVVEELKEVSRENYETLFHEKKTSFVIEYPIITGKGNWKYLTGRGRIYYDKEGEPLEMQGVYQDITEAHLAYKELEKNQFVLSEAQAIAQIGSWEFITGESSFRGTREFYRLLNMPDETILNKEHFFAAIHPLDRADQEDHFNKALKNQKAYESRFRVKDHVQQDRWIRFNAKVDIALHTGKTQRVYGTAQDVTDMTLAYQDLEKNREKLTEAQHIAHIGSWEIDPETGIREWTDEHYIIFRFQPGKPVDTTSVMQRIHPDDRAMVQESFRLAMKEGKGYHIRYRLNFPDGIERWVSSTCHVDFNHLTHKPVRVFGTTQDITEMVEKENQLKELNAGLEKRVQERTRELEDSNNNLQHFAYIVSHDLKAPLRAIANIVSFIRTDYREQLDDTGREYLDLLDERTRFMEALIQNILEYSRAGGKKEDISDVDVRLLVEKVIRDIPSEDNIEFILNPLPVILTRFTLLYQIFQNLISNAVRHVDPRKGQVEIGHTDEGSHQLFWVRDNGVGIEPKHFERIFKIFQTLGGEKSGSGIGLAIVKKLMGILEGEVWVESEPGKGSTFLFRFPATISETAGV